MPVPQRSLTCNDVRRIAEESLTGSGSDRVGIEIEWPVFQTASLARPAMADLQAVLVEPLPAGGSITIEPGGQIELSTTPCDSAVAAVAAAEIDAAALRDRLRSRSLAMAACAVDTLRPPQRILNKPRYAAMENFYSVRGPEGLWMMANTASVQINLSHASRGGHRRWYLMNRIGPLLVALFANSPGQGPDGRHWKSVRQAIWSRIDPSRTKPVPVGDSPVHDWASYALAADVFYINAEPGTAIAPGLSFGDWLTFGHEVGWPTANDLRYHLTTLFPPIRPRGWLELRMLDALTPEIRSAAVYIASTALDDDIATEIDELPDVGHLWLAAARDGLEHPVLGTAARRLVDLCSSATRGSGDVASTIDAFADEYTRRGRCPADDIADLTVTAFTAQSDQPIS
ncbi:glutamate-cysteine ligase family protein [Gordonia sp. OPL2]|uniref:glutamate-cysteine ligase family protein n=1 Tax=Gordonia sp. OPL2 TaxID=2486274 RepID=UPI00165620C7|nr:glutamate-cysteine ligase family protein [Gordonia sp. OPL2]ROZ88025.1 glutamate--cysteine ligase [Gordonia sp. OPL2]